VFAGFFGWLDGEAGRLRLGDGGVKELSGSGLRFCDIRGTGVLFAEQPCFRNAFTLFLRLRRWATLVADGDGY